jgi:uncharacterized protein (TIGR00255 family)
VRAGLQKRLTRGRVDVFVGVQYKSVPSVEVVLNLPVVEALAASMDNARHRGLVDGCLRPGDLLRVPQAVVFRETSEPSGAAVPPELQALVEAAVEAAGDELDAMRRREGEMLRRDLDARRDGLVSTLARIAAAAEEGRVATEGRLAQRIRDLSLEVNVDPTLIAQEVVRFVARADISEEVVRFRAHLEHWAHLTGGEEPCGRKLDFLLQELNREINTIGSKAEGTSVTELVVHVKSELERMREQIQNVV